VAIHQIDGLKWQENGGRVMARGDWMFKTLLITATVFESFLSYFSKSVSNFFTYRCELVSYSSTRIQRISVGGEVIAS
jgi:hypothetical protein